MDSLLRDLGELLLGGAWNEAAIRDRLESSFNVCIEQDESVPEEETFSLERFISSLIANFPPDRQRPRRHELRRFLAEDASAAGLAAIATLSVDPLDIPREPIAPLRASFLAWNVPQLDSTGQLGDWLGLSPQALAWHTSTKKRVGRTERYQVKIAHTLRGRRRVLEIPPAA